MNGVVALGCCLGLTAALGLLLRRQDGRLRQTRAVARREPRRGEDVRPLIPKAGSKATLLQFSTAFCAPCRATKRILSEVAAVVDGVEHVEVDAESNLDLVRRLNILKTPTTIVLDAHGTEVLRATGQPKKAHVLSALGETVGARGLPS